MFILGMLLLSCFALHAGDMPRPIYPRPQFERSDWINLNGEWTYVFDFGRSGSERGFAESSWGYGKDAQTEEDYFIRLEALTDAILSFDHIVGYCYTQLTDVEQEQNGVYNYDRSEKFDSRKFYRIFSKTKELE